MGGTFDPIHIGHLIAAETAREHMACNEIWFVPNFLSPHKQRVPYASAQQRVDMLMECFVTTPQYRVVDIEIMRKGKSFTIDTVMTLTETYPQHEFYLIIGSDMIEKLPKWYKIDQIAAKVSFIGVVHDNKEVSLHSQSLELLEQITIIQMPTIELSSTMIRDKCAAGQSVKHLVPDPVYEYITKHHLYQTCS